MKFPRRKLLQLAMGAAPLSILLAFADRIAWSQNLRTVSFIVPFPAGGGLDLLARVLARQIAQTTGLTIVVENRPGAASIVGAEYVSRAAPDGSTVLQVGNALIIHPFFKKLNYDPLTSFAPISLLAMSPQVIVVNQSFAARYLGDSPLGATVPNLGMCRGDNDRWQRAPCLRCQRPFRSSCWLQCARRPPVRS